MALSCFAWRYVKKELEFAEGGGEGVVRKRPCGAENRKDEANARREEKREEK